MRPQKCDPFPPKNKPQKILVEKKSIFFLAKKKKYLHQLVVDMKKKNLFSLSSAGHTKLCGSICKSLVKFDIFTKCSIFNQNTKRLSGEEEEEDDEEEEDKRLPFSYLSTWMSCQCSLKRQTWKLTFKSNFYEWESQWTSLCADPSLIDPQIRTFYEKNLI